MSIEGIRFRMEGELCVLQVLERQESRYGCDQVPAWRDAKATDLLEVSRFCTNRDSLTRLEGTVNSLEYRMGNLLKVEPA
jgi:hypothetical protein